MDDLKCPDSPHFRNSQLRSCWVRYECRKYKIILGVYGAVKLDDIMRKRKEEWYRIGVNGSAIVKNIRKSSRFTPFDGMS